MTPPTSSPSKSTPAKARGAAHPRHLSASPSYSPSHSPSHSLDRALSDDSVVLTPPPSSPSPRPHASPASPVMEEQEVIELVSSEDEFNSAAVVSPPRAPAPWSAMEQREVEAQIQALTKGIMANEMLLKSGGLRMADGGAQVGLPLADRLGFIGFEVKNSGYIQETFELYFK